MSLLHLDIWSDIDIDDVLARCIMGWHKHHDYILVMSSVYIPKTDLPIDRHWSPSTNIRDTFEVIEKIKNDSIFVAIDSLPRGFKIRVTSPNCRLFETVESLEALPMRISRLIMRATLCIEEGETSGKYFMEHK
ncbi:BC1872 family protein (plasmid) [Paenibacillus sp. EC2-1]|uniref:BC1872 family protein n=1 Tax=Paenibacillus sp. EC2-1 TaxID=3388665 RepID=UPI003BEEB413